MSSRFPSLTWLIDDIPLENIQKFYESILSRLEAIFKANSGKAPKGSNISQVFPYSDQPLYYIVVHILYL